MAELALTITVTSVASTAVTFAPAAPFTGTGDAFTVAGIVASGTLVGTVTVEPSDWAGTLALSGADAAAFTLNGMQLMTAAELTIGGGTSGAYAVAIVATP